MLDRDAAKVVVENILAPAKAEVEEKDGDYKASGNTDEAEPVWEGFEEDLKEK